MLKCILFVLIGAVLLVVGYNYYPEPELPAEVKIDYLLADKSERKLSAFSNGKLLKNYSISLGHNPTGDKEFEGDKKTPEGVYSINAKNPYSGYHKNLGISYPNQADKAYSRKLGKPTGGDIKIHGLRNGTGFIGKLHRFFDWTHGCMAVTNREMDELYTAVEPGTRIEIKP